MSSDLDDDDWAQVLAGQSEAFGRIFDRRYDMVRRQASRHLQRPSEVEDAVAVAFFELWRHRATVPVIAGSIAPWLLVTTANVARHHRRSRIRYDNLLAQLPPPEPAAAPDDHLERIEVLAAFRRLSANDQRVLTLCVLEGYSERDAAAALGIAPGTVKSRLHRAKQRLARLLPDAFTPVHEEGFRHGA